ncbi:MAG: hypothetical protein ACAI25_20615 [Planctomycetota bacterium]
MPTASIPSARAIWPAATPTPPAAEWTRRRSPFRMRATFTIPCHAVR